MKTKWVLAVLCLSMGLACANLTGCAMGGHIGPVGGGAEVG